MTKTQTATIIVNELAKDGYYCCRICTNMIIDGNTRTFKCPPNVFGEEIKEYCIKGVAQFLIDIQKERYGGRNDTKVIPNNTDNT